MARHIVTPPIKGRRVIKPTVMDTGLTVEQEAYCQARAMGMDQKEAHAAICTHLSPNTTAQWERKNLAISNRIRELSKAAADNAILKTGLNREWVINRLMQVVDRCMQAEPVMVKGEPTGEYRFDAMGANAALRMLGDSLQLFKPIEKKPEDDYANLSDEDIALIAAELASQTGLVEALAGDEEAPGPQQAGQVQALPPPG